MDRQIGAFEILPDPVTGRGFHRLGEGTFGITYKARHRLGHEVALKILKFDKNDPKAERFENEAKVLYSLRHPRIASFLHYDLHKGFPYCCMEFCSGGNLQEISRRRGGLPAPVVLEIGRQVCEALAYAHGRPSGAVIHRDIKPENLMLGSLDNEGVGVKVIDFGLAKVFSEETSTESELTQSSDGFKGTSLFASPEQWREAEIDGRADCYSLGMTLWYLACGGKPAVFEGKRLAEVSAVHLSSEAFALDEVDPLLRPVLGRLLAKDPADRFEDSGEALAAFVEILDQAGLEKSQTDLSAFAETPEPTPGEGAETPVRSSETFGQSGYELREKWWTTSVGPVFGCRTPGGEDSFLLILDDACDLRLDDREREIHYRHFLELRRAALSRSLPPALIAVRQFHWFADEVTAVEMEPLWAVSLREVIRRRRKLSFTESLTLLQHLAVAMDYLSEHRLPVPDLSDSRLLISLADPARFLELETFIEADLGGWPRFVLKVLPLGGDVEEGRTGLDPADLTATFDVSEESAAFSGLSRFAAKVYSLMAGHQVAQAAFFASEAFSEIPGLSADGNALLQTVIAARGKTSASCRELLLSLCRTEGTAFPEALADANLITCDMFRTVRLQGDPQPGLSSVDGSLQSRGMPPSQQHSFREAAAESSRKETDKRARRTKPVLLAAALAAGVAVCAAVMFWPGVGLLNKRTEPVPIVEGPPPDPTPEPPVSEPAAPDSDDARPGAMEEALAKEGQADDQAPPSSVVADKPPVEKKEKAVPARSPGDLAVPDMVPTISEAIAQAAAGATITVRGGEYRESLKITKAIRIVGSDQTAVEVVAPSENVPALLVENAADVHLERLKFGHPGDQLGDGEYPPVGVIRFSSVSFSGCEFLRGAGDGVKATGEGTVVDFESSQFVSHAGTGLFLERGAVAKFRNCRFERNGGSGLTSIHAGSSVSGRESSFLANGQHGAEINLGASANFRECSFFESGKAGILVAGVASRANLEKNVFTRNMAAGVSVENGGIVTITDNEFEGTRARGITFFNPGSGSEVRNNRVSNSVEWGICFLADSEVSVTIEGNTCRGNGYVGIAVDGPAVASIRGNTCIENKEHGIEMTGGVTGELSGNECRNNSLHGIHLEQVSPGLIVGQNESSGNGQSDFFRE